MASNRGKGNYIGTDALYFANKDANVFDGIWTLEGQKYLNETKNWAYPGEVTYATLTVPGTSYSHTLFLGESATFVTSSNNGTLGGDAAGWTDGGNTGASFRKDAPTALDYRFVVPTSPFTIDVTSAGGAIWDIEMTGGGGNGGGDSTGGGGNGGFVVWSGSVPNAVTSLTAKVGPNAQPTSLSSPVFTLAANAGGSGNGGGCDQRGPGGGGGGASGGNVVNQGGNGGGGGSTACGGCSSGGGGGGASSYTGTYYPNNTTFNTFPNPWGSGYGGSCGPGSVRYFGGGGGQPGGDNAGGAGGGYGLIRMTYRGGL